MCRFGIHPTTRCERLKQVGLTLSLFSVPAFITDPINRFIWVNSGFARLVGDPIADGLSPERRIIHSLVAETYRDRFVQGVDLVATCLPVLVNEIDQGNLAPAARRVVDELVAGNPDLRRALARPKARWNGVLSIRGDRGHRTAVREQVTVVADPNGKPSGFHIGLWFPAQSETAPVPREVDGGVTKLLTARQLEIARLYATGLHSREVSAK